jgi:hypothetical protein
MGLPYANSFCKAHLIHGCTNEEVVRSLGRHLSHFNEEHLTEKYLNILDNLEIYER